MIPTEPSTPSLDDYRWLIGAEGARWLAQAEAGSASLLRMAARLRSQLSGARSHLVLEQVDLRRRAAEKFSSAAELFFTRVGLEQATDEFVAKYKANRFARNALVVDLCCGIGGDLMAIAARGRAVGVDLNAAVALLASENCRRAGAGDVEVRAERVEDTELGDATAWHLDPDRRAAGRRTTRVEAYQPGLETIARLRQQCVDGAIKLAPAAECPAEWPPEAELEWISRGGECRQLVVWFGGLARRPGERVATIVSSGAGSSRSLIGTAEVVPDFGTTVGAYLYEPDSAVLAAGLLGALAAEHGLRQFEPDVVYLTGDRLIEDAALAAFAIDDVLPLDLKKVRRYLQQREIGRLEVKKRGVSLDPAIVRKQFSAVRGDASATLLLTRLAGRTVAIVARRIHVGTE